MQGRAERMMLFFPESISFQVPIISELTKALKCNQNKSEHIQNRICIKTHNSYERFIYITCSLDMFGKIIKWNFWAPTQI